MMIQRIGLGAWALLGAPGLLAGCSSDDAGDSGSLEITVSAEGLGANGYGFPPALGQEVAFVDGWAVNFERIVVAIDNVRLSRSPDKDPGDQSVVGETVALRTGPFVVDLKGEGDAQDKGGAGEVAIRLPIDDLDGLFDLDQRYAFSFDLVVPTGDSILVNLEEDDPALVAMIDDGLRGYVAGQARFKGTDCTASDSAYDFEALPRAVDFTFGLDGSVHSGNCQNPDNTGEALEGEESQRGIQMETSGVTTAQITIHTDHLFWSTVSHENLPIFNQFAANAKRFDDGYRVELSDLENVSLPAIKDVDGNPLPWRSCVDSSLYELPTQSQMTFDAGSQSLSNLADFVKFNALTMGHLNADGLCYSEAQ